MRTLLAIIVWASSVGAAAHAQSASREAASLQGQFVRAMTARALGDDSTAVGALDLILRQRPDDPAVLALRAEVALDTGSPADAVFFADRAVSVAPDQPDVWRVLASAYQASGQVTEATAAFDRARQLAPDDLDTLLALLDLATSQADEQTEREVLQELVRIGDTVAARLRLSVLAERAGDADDALAQAEAAALLAPAEPAVRRRLDDLGETGSTTPVASASGTELFEAGRYAEAADALLVTVEDNPRDLEAWDLALRSLAETADPRAAQVADDALLLFGSVPSILASAAEAYASIGRSDDARSAAQRGLDALDLIGDDAVGAGALRQRLEAVLQT
ncbi:MAG: tetratricopeptide repeat protein [Bacteroidota bacterium]